MTKAKSYNKTPPCGLCGETKKPRHKTECCGNWVCGDESEYVMFSYSRDICSRNHRRFTLCGVYRCDDCPITDKEREEIIREYEKKQRSPQIGKENF